MNELPRPTVSVVIATYNYGRFLAQALDSVLVQTMQDFEILVVDDGSTDQTQEVMRPYLGDPSVHYLRHEHLGQPKTKNAGIRASRGKYIAFLDADDAWLPSKLEKQISIFERDTEGRIGVVYSRRAWMDEDGRPITRRERIPQRGDVLTSLFYRPFVCFSSSVVRRCVLDEVGLFDESIQYSIDYDLWLRIALTYRFDYVDEPLTRYRTGHANMSSRADERVWCVRTILDRFLLQYGGKERLDPGIVRLTMADHYCDVAAAAGRGRPLFAAGCYSTALTFRAFHPPAWRGLAVGWWLDPLKQRLKTWLRPGNRRDPTDKTHSHRTESIG